MAVYVHCQFILKFGGLLGPVGVLCLRLCRARKRHLVSVGS